MQGCQPKQILKKGFNQGAYPLWCSAGSGVQWCVHLGFSGISIVHPIDYSIKDATGNSYLMSIVAIILDDMCNQQQRNVYGMILLTQYLCDQNCQTHAYNSHIPTLDRMDQFRQTYGAP